MPNRRTCAVSLRSFFPSPLLPLQSRPLSQRVKVLCWNDVRYERTGSKGGVLLVYHVKLVRRWRGGTVLPLCQYSTYVRTYRTVRKVVGVMSLQTRGFCVTKKGGCGEMDTVYHHGFCHHGCAATCFSRAYPYIYASIFTTRYRNVRHTSRGQTPGHVSTAAHQHEHGSQVPRRTPYILVYCLRYGTVSVVFHQVTSLVVPRYYPYRRDGPRVYSYGDARWMVRDV